MRQRNPLLHPHVYKRVIKRSRGYLPHWQVDEGLYSITFRLTDSLPLHIYERICEERKAFEHMLTEGVRKPTAIEKEKIRKFLFDRVDRELDAGWGSCWMKRPEIAGLVADSLKFFDGIRYNLAAWCVMPNHVHVVTQLRSGETLDGVCKSWKSHSGREANRLISREGRFWQREYFDRLIRSADDLRRTVDYVVSNPVKAGLVDWPWTGGG